MERLTVRGRKGRAYFDEDGLLIRGANGAFHLKKDMTAHFIHQRFVALDKVIDRLAAYEDTGLTPEEVAELVRLKENGRLVVLPCKVGDTVYWIDQYRRQIKPLKILCFSVDHKGIDEIGCWDGDYTPMRFYPDNFGKTVFLVREQAEAALAAWEGAMNETDSV